jgi:hypothetical protein
MDSVLGLYLRHSKEPGRDAAVTRDQHAFRATEPPLRATHRGLGERKVVESFGLAFRRARYAS